MQEMAVEKSTVFQKLRCFTGKENRIIKVIEAKKMCSIRETQQAFVIYRMCNSKVAEM